MNKRTLVILIVSIAIFAAGSLSASHTLAIGSVNYYDFYDLEAGDTEQYIPGVRLEYYFNDNLGVSVDSIVIEESNWHQYREMVYILDAVFRLPLDPLEPYLGIGPTYRGYEDRHDSDIDSEPFAYNVRFGVDFIALEWLSFGIESNFLVDDVGEFFDTLAHSSVDEIADAVRDYSLIGLTAKIRF
ncbi:MAG: hypothetical protein JXK93_14340 [Sphaerochaetaceae bacterium]|nr:hypothetical protein [Sphaerochaetaceae bacterium]